MPASPNKAVNLLKYIAIHVGFPSALLMSSTCGHSGDTGDKPHQQNELIAGLVNAGWDFQHNKGDTTWEVISE